jgi:hypothetical protein
MRVQWLGVLAVVASSTNAVADSDHYENVRVDAGLTGSSVSVNDRNGTGMAVEIKGMSRDNIAIGGRVEVAVMFGGVVGADEAPLDIAMAASGLLKGEYLFGTGTIRPFVGLGVGGYTIGAQTIAAGPNRDGIRRSTGRYFGVAPQVGLDIGRVRIAATYNAILGAYLELHETIGTVETTTKLSQNYLSLELSFQFAGGRKQPVRARKRSRGSF